MKHLLMFLFIFLAVTIPVSAHPGKTAADGCHICKTNCDKWGVPWYERHCHGGAATVEEAPLLPTATLVPTRKPTVVKKKKVAAKKPTPTPTPKIKKTSKSRW